MRHEGAREDVVHARRGRRRARRRPHRCRTTWTRASRGAPRACSASVAWLSFANSPSAHSHDKRIASFEGRPGRVGDHRDARHQERGVVETVHFDDLTHARAPSAPANRRRGRAVASKTGLLAMAANFMPGTLDVETEQALSADDRAVVDVRHARADQPVAARILQWRARRARSAPPPSPRDRRSGPALRLAACCTTPRSVSHSRSGTAHCWAAARTSRRRAVAPKSTKTIPVGADRIAPAHALSAILLAVERRVLDADARPVGVELLDEQHRAARSSSLRPCRAAPTRS